MGGAVELSKWVVLMEGVVECIDTDSSRAELRSPIPMPIPIALSRRANWLSNSKTALSPDQHPRQVFEKARNSF